MAVSPKLVLAGVVAAAGIAGAAVFLNTPRTPEALLQQQAEEYVVLALGLDGLQEGEVDAYFGPPELREEATGNHYSLADIQARTRALREAIQASATPPELTARRDALLAKTTQLLTIAEVLSLPAPLGFADELNRLYGIQLGDSEVDHEALKEELDTLLPGRGALAFKMASFQNKLVIPPDRRQAVFEAALAECRKRTAAHWPLPADENLAIEFTRDVQAAWHEYKGAYRSSLRINPLTVALVSVAVDLACHETYPGHHAQYLLLEQAAPLQVEDTVILLRSPFAVLTEGAANAGVALAFTPEERLAFERDVLFPLAGLPADQAELNLHIHTLVTALSGAIIPVLQDYYDGEVDFNAASFRLEREAMVTSPLPLLEFVNDYGTYSSGYTLVRDLISAHLATAGDTAAQWDALASLLTAPAPVALADLQGE